MVPNPARLLPSGRESLPPLQKSGASFFAPLHAALGGVLPKETVDTLWSLVWKGRITNDTLHGLRAYLRTPERARRPGRPTPFRSRRLVPASAEGRWSVVNVPPERSLTEWATAFSRQLLTRHGVVTREVTAIEQLPGGFSSVYPVLRRMEETGRVRRGYFVAGLGAAQFAQPGAVDRLRAARDDHDTPGRDAGGHDRANPFGALLAWPDWPVSAAQPGRDGDAAPRAIRASRSAGARVILVDGRLATLIARGERRIARRAPLP